MPVRLRPVTETDLSALSGADSPYENFGPRGARTTAHDPSLTADPGGLAVVDDGDAENKAEQRALEKAGLRLDGVARGAQWREGAYHDQFVYSILRADWEAR